MPKRLSATHQGIRAFLPLCLAYPLARHGSDDWSNRVTRVTEAAFERTFADYFRKAGSLKMIVSELARTSGVTPHAVRYYSRIGLLRPNKDVWNKYRRFSRDDVRRLTFIKKAQRLGLTLDEITQLVDACERRAPTCPNVRAIVVRRIADTEAEIRSKSELLGRMRRAVEAWEALPDGVPDGETVCHLIESFADDDAMSQTDPHHGNKKGR